MYVKQISVFIENTPGRLAHFTKLLGDNNIDLVSLSVADTTHFGILRGIVADYDKAVKLISASRRRILGLKNENVRLQKKIEEIRLVDRAKCALIEYLGMTEAQAHRHIEKQAMDLRMTRREVAQGILQTYES